MQPPSTPQPEFDTTNDSPLGPNVATIGKKTVVVADAVVRSPRLPVGLLHFHDGAPVISRAIWSSGACGGMLVVGGATAGALWCPLHPPPLKLAGTLASWAQKSVDTLVGAGLSAGGPY